MMMNVNLSKGLVKALAALGLTALPLLATAAPTQLIVQFRADARTLQPKAQRLEQNMRLLQSQSRFALTAKRETFNGAQVIVLDQTLSANDEKALIAKLAALPEVASVEPDRILYRLPIVAAEAEPLASQFIGKSNRAALLAPNDPQYSTQWSLDGSPGSINAAAAWDLVKGNSAGVVAVLDTGQLPHSQMNGRILPGYDFVGTDRDGTNTRANDGDGRDADPTDPGDWVTSADAATLNRTPEVGDAGGCSAQGSSWHGTSVAGMIAANSNDGIGLAGIDWLTKILPVRVLGKCGERTSDVADGIAWAGGVDVAGTPKNLNPAQVINLSLGAPGECSPVLTAAMEAAFLRGVTRAVVIAAGNSNYNFSQDTPANCPHAIAVAANTSSGSKASFSSFGFVTMTAPGSAIPALSNTGSTVAAAETTRSISGTSFSSPITAGVVSLMLGANPELSANQVRSILVRSSRAFTNTTCSYATCGGGLLDAFEAVKLAKATAGEGGGKIPSRGLAKAFLGQHDSATDIWYVPSESGWGMNITHRGQNPKQPVFGVLYIYNEAGQPLWFTINDGAWLSDKDYVSRLYRASGPAQSGAFASASVRLTQSGTAKLSFIDASTIALTVQLADGKTITKEAKRLVF
jgi:Subtilase family